MRTEEQLLVRVLLGTDIPAALRLKELAGWNQTETDWRRLIQLEPNGCFCAMIADRLVGTTTTTTYGHELAWIGMVLVHPEHRKRGIAKKMLQVAIDYLSERGVATVKLDATPEGRPVYEKLGFKVESMIERWAGIASSTRNSNCTPLDASLHSELFAVDRSAFGVDRSRLIEILIKTASVQPVAVLDPNGRLASYALARRGSNNAYIGPVLAKTAEQVTALLDCVLRQLSGERVCIDLNTDFDQGSQILTSYGFRKQRDLFRMSYGTPSTIGSMPGVFAIAGPEVG